MDTDVAVRRALTDIDREVRGWLGEHEPLARTDLSAIGGEFRREVGEPAGTDGVRAASPAALGTFAARHGTVLYEFDDDPGFGAVVGYPVDDSRWAPVLLCAGGPAAEAGALVEAFADAAEEATDGELARP